MLQSEIDEISQAFMDAWEQYFGQLMYYVPYISAQKHPVYGESKGKTYDFANKAPFYGTFKIQPINEVGGLPGKDEPVFAEITCVTKALLDHGIKEVKNKDMIQLVDSNGNATNYNIIQHYGKVQFSESRIFTKFLVVDRFYE